MREQKKILFRLNKEEICLKMKKADAYLDYFNGPQTPENSGSRDIKGSLTARSTIEDSKLIDDGIIDMLYRRHSTNDVSSRIDSSYHDGILR